MQQTGAMMKHVVLVLLLSAAPALAQSTTPLDLNAVDPSMLEGFFGPWQIQNADASKTCDVTLSRDETMGGLSVAFAHDCAANFPVTGDIAAWRLYEGFEIALVDSEKHERLRFVVPDNNYVAVPETDGIATIVQVSDEISPAP